MLSKKFSVFFFFAFVTLADAGSQPPHIIVIVADDLGWNDVGFHGSNQIPTPNIDALAYSGVILNNYYVNPICTPSRSALLTGYHPIHTGLQSGVLKGAAPYALPLKFKLMPEYLNSIGYKSMAVGKWHLGSHRAVYTPTKRGFHSHLGYWTGHLDYYDHTAEEFYHPVEGWGIDFRRNTSVAGDLYGQYATDIFTKEAVDIINNHKRLSPKDQPLFLYLAHLAVHSANTYSPLQAPSEVVDKFANIEDTNRRKFAGMLYKLDESVGLVVEALEKNGMLNKSIILFTTDNGGPAAGFDINAASNWPLKGVKDTLWEGGVRGACFIWSPLLQSTPRVSNQLMNIQDWLPTLYSAAGGKASNLPSMDGMDFWKALSKGSKSPRNILLHNIDESRYIQAIRISEWKYVQGTTYGGNWDGWYGPDGRNGTYNLDQIYDSKAAKAIQRAGITGLPPKEKVLSLRASSTVTCGESVNISSPCHILNQVCLFNITADPCERENLAFKYPSVVQMMRDTLETFKASAVPRLNKPVDARANPKYFQYTWTNWLDFVDPDSKEAII